MLEHEVLTELPMFLTKDKVFNIYFAIGRNEYDIIVYKDGKEKAFLISSDASLHKKCHTSQRNRKYDKKLSEKDVTYLLEGYHAAADKRSHLRGRELGKGPKSYWNLFRDLLVESSRTKT